MGITIIFAKEWQIKAYLAITLVNSFLKKYGYITNIRYKTYSLLLLTIGKNYSCPFESYMSWVESGRYGPIIG